MYNYKHTVKGIFDIDKLWNLYSNVSQWSSWDRSIDNAAMDGEFKEGMTGIMYMKNMPPLPFILDEVNERKSFSNSSSLGNIKVVFEHKIEECKNGEYEITHSVKISGDEQEKLQGIGQGITAAIPNSMKNLTALSGMK